MRSLTKEFWLNIPQRGAIVSLHREIERLVEDSGIQEGLALVNTKQIQVHSLIR